MRLKKLNQSNISLRNESNSGESIVKDLKDAIKTGLSPRDSGARRDYKLTTKWRF